MLSPDLPTEQKTDARPYVEADASLAAVTETIATVLDLVNVLHAEEYGYPGGDDAIFFAGETSGSVARLIDLRTTAPQLSP